MKRFQVAICFTIAVLLLSISFASPVNAQTTAPENPLEDGQSSAVVLSEEWAKYTHPEWGVTITYPDSWTLSVPDFDKMAQPPAERVPEGYTYNPNIEQMRLLGYAVSLYIPGQDNPAANEVTVALDTFTLSKDGDLHAWVDLRNQLNATENPLADETTVTQVETTELPFAKAGDQVVYVIIENKFLHSEVIWIAKGELVFLVMSNSTDPKVQELFFQVASSLEFDTGKLAEIRAKAPFTGDEQQLKESVAHLQPQPTPECDIACRDQKAMEEMFSVPASLVENSAQEISLATRPSMTQKALPSNWFSPIAGIYAFSYNVLCGSSFHTGNAEFAVDVSVGTGTPVYALYAGRVSRSDYDTTGYGNLVLVETSLSIADESRTYYHAYAHLSQRVVNVNDWVSRGTLLGYSGNTTGNGVIIGYHLHYHIRDANNNPVDATPVVGFRSNLNYPNVNTSCGQSVRYQDDEVVIESVAFSQRFARSNYAWYCINPPSATVECYMIALPDVEGGFEPLNTATSPEVRYSIELAQPSNPSTWYAWSCGDAGTDGRDDTLHMGIDNGSPSTLRAVLIAQPGWAWVSAVFPTMHRPTFTANSGAHTFNTWIREDGARYGRILLTRDANFNPTGNVQCGPYP